jgi:hypothetical protein
MLLGRAGFLCIFGLRDDAKLLHHAQGVPHGPVFHHLPVRDAHDIDELKKQIQELQQIGRQRQAEKLTKLRELTEGANLTPT